MAIFDWLVSVIAGRWLPLAVLAVIGGALTLSHCTAYSRGKANVQAAWDVQKAKNAETAAAAQKAADERVARERAAREASDKGYADAKRSNAVLVAANTAAHQRMQELAREHRDRLRAATAPADCAAGLAAYRDWSGRAAGVVAEGGGVAGRIAQARDDARARVSAAVTAWPRE